VQGSARLEALLCVHQPKGRRRLGASGKDRPGAAWSFLDRNDDGHLRAPVPERRRWAGTGASGITSDRLTRHIRDMEVNSPMKTKGTSISTGCVFKRSQWMNDDIRSAARLGLLAIRGTELTARAYIVFPYQGLQRSAGHPFGK